MFRVPGGKLGLAERIEQPEGPAGLLAEAVLLAALGAFVATTRLMQPPVWIDDAFIHFRNVRNFAEGQGLFFNPGERLIGSTSPVYVFLLGLAARLGGFDVPLLARAFNCAADFAAAVLGLRLLAWGGVPRVFRYAVVMTVVAEPLGLLYSTAGMEMSLFLMASLGILLAFERGWWLPGGLALGILGWVRPEGVTVAIAGLAALLLERRHGVALRATLAATASALVAAGALFVYYGTVLPQSLISKSADSPWFPTLDHHAAWDFFLYLASLTPLPAIFPGAATSGAMVDRVAIIACAALQAGLTVAGGLYLRRKARVAGGALLGFAALYYIFYAAANPMLFEWYYVPLGFLSLLLGGAGWWALTERVIRFAVAHGETTEGSSRGIAAAAGVTVGAVLLLGLTNGAIGGGRFESEGALVRRTLRVRPMEPFDRLRLYEQAGKVMEGWRTAMPEAVAATPEIGVFSYHYRGRILDPYALVSPQSLGVLEGGVQEKLREVGVYHPVNVYVHLKPEFIMTAGLFLPYVPDLMESMYEEVRRPDVPLLRLFVRRDLPEAVKREARGERRPG